jgi:hypothetical protein
VDGVVNEDSTKTALNLAGCAGHTGVGADLVTEFKLFLSRLTQTNQTSLFGLLFFFFYK